jgi:hypothetical protein
MITKIRRKEGSTSWGVKDATTGITKNKYDNCFDKWVPGLNRTTGVLMTGLTPKEEVEFEKKLGLPEGSLGKNGSFWDNFSIIIPEKGLDIESGDPLGELQLKCLRADSSVAGSLEDAMRKANVSYIITTEGGEAKVQNVKRDSIAKAYKIYADMTPSEVEDALYLFGKNPDSTDSEVSKNMLGAILDKNPEKFLNVLGDPKVKDKVWMIKLIRAGIVRKQGVSSGFDVALYYGEIYLGKGLDEAIEKVREKEFSNILIGLKKEYEDYKKA